MDVRGVGSLLLLALFAACGASRSDQPVTRSTEASSSSAATCQVEVVNPTYETLSLSQALRGVRGSQPVGVVERRANFRFSAPCARGTVYLYGYSDGFREGDLVATGWTRLDEDRVVTLELERRLF